MQTNGNFVGRQPALYGTTRSWPGSGGQKPEALRIAHELETMARERYVSPYGLAQIYASLNDKEHTFQWLQAAYDDHAVWMGYLRVDPIFDHYRSDQRFQDLLRRTGLI